MSLQRQSRSQVLHAFPFACFIAGVVTYATFTALRSSKSKPSGPDIIPSPLKDVSLNPDQKLPYPPDGFIPGGRDVNTPWGNLRVYEFGPEYATRKVLLIHGISTPCVALAGIAERLAKDRCRVMLFDAFGRGWSDAPTVEFDEGLFTSMIFAALMSSPISWTGTQGVHHGFTLLGYSLGGCIAANFTSRFPELVNDLVLIAPAGLLKSSRTTWQTRLLYSGLIPDSVVSNIVKRRLATNPNVRTKTQETSIMSAESIIEQDVATAEIPDTNAALPMAFGHAIDAEAIVKWQMDSHPGFTSAFISSFKHAPIHDQHERWGIIGQRLDKQRKALSNSSSENLDKREGLYCGKVLAIVGATDPIIVASDFEKDAVEVLGAQNIEIRRIDCGHELAITHSKDIVDFISQQWQQAA